MVEKHKEILQSLVLISHEGYVREWDWDFTNSITTPYFGGVHWHRGKHQGTPGLADIIAHKSIFALYSAIVRTFEGITCSHCTALYDDLCHILD